MKMMVMKIMFIISTLISIMKTPLTMGSFLLMQTSLATMLLSMMMKSSWMPMIMFLMLVGGMLILFMYMSSIASNEKFTPNFKMIIPSVVLILPLENLMTESSWSEMLNSNMTSESISMAKIYNKKTMMLTVLLFMYLLLTMIVVTKIVKIFKGPLRSK